MVGWRICGGVGKEWFLGAGSTAKAPDGGRGGDGRAKVAVAGPGGGANATFALAAGGCDDLMGSTGCVSSYRCDDGSRLPRSWSAGAGCRASSRCRLENLL